MDSERGLDEWTPHGDSYNDYDCDSEAYNSTDGQKIADIIIEQQEDKKRAAFIKSLLGDSTDTGEKTIYFTKKKVGKWN